MRSQDEVLLEFRIDYNFYMILKGSYHFHPPPLQGIKHELDDCGRKLQFWATGTGARGRDEYYFELNLHAQLKTTGKVRVLQFTS